MKVAVFGATGPTGQQVVRQALAQGYNVVALARNPDRLAIHDPRLSIIPGNVLDPQSVEMVVDSSDAVLSCLGRRPFRDPGVVIAGTRNLVTAMKKLGVRRLIIESAYGAGNSYSLAGPGLKFVVKTLLHWAYREKEVMEPEVAASGLEWVIVRPPALRNGGRTGKYRVGEELRLGAGSWINRADVADFMLKQVASDEWLRKTPAISM
jgi:putative NADH-flavin reductase